MSISTLIKRLKPQRLPGWIVVAQRFHSTSPSVATARLREVVTLDLETGFAVQACVTFSRITSDGGTQAAQAAWQALLPALQRQKPSFVVVQSSANHRTASAAVRLVDAQLKALSGSSKYIPPIIGFSATPWLPEGQGLAASRLAEQHYERQRHIRITAAVLADTEAASFHATSDSFPRIPNLEAALTTRPPHVMLLPHPSFSDTQLSNLISRLEAGFQNAEVLGLVPLAPLPDQAQDSLESAKGGRAELEAFRSEAASILGDANAAGDLAGPLAVAAAEAEALTLDQLDRQAEEEESQDWNGAVIREEAAVFVGDTSFMQGAVGLTLMPPSPAARVPLQDLAALACLVFGTDKSYGLFMSVELRKLVYAAKSQQSQLALPEGSDQTEDSASPFLTAADLDDMFVDKKGVWSAAARPEGKPDATDGSPARQEAQTQTQQVQSESQEMQLQSQEVQPQSQVAQGPKPPLPPATIDPSLGLFAQNWRAAPVAPAGLVSLLGAAAQITVADGQASDAHWHGQPSDAAAAMYGTGLDVRVSDAQTTEQMAGPLPLFAVDVVLWPDQLMVLRAFEPRYTRLIRCCQESQGCFGLVAGGVGTTAIFDSVHSEDDGSYSVTIRGGRRFLVQAGSAHVVPATFGLTAVQPHFIHDIDADSLEATKLASEAASILVAAHTRAKSQERAMDDEQPEDSASRWREGVLQDAGASAAFAGAFNLPGTRQQAKPEADVREEWGSAAAQELSFLLGSALPVPTTLRRRWLNMESLIQRLQHQLELLSESRVQRILGNILRGLPDDSRFHDLLYKRDTVSA